MANLNEKWEYIPGYEGYYQASSLGNIRSVDRMVNHVHGMCLKKGIDLKPFPNKKGYLKVKLQKEANVKTTSVHRLIALTFIPNPNNLPQINHKKGIKTDNRVSEIEWCTNQQNQKHRFDFLVNKEEYAIKMRTPERRKKIGISVSRSKNPYAKKVIDTTTGVVYGCIGDAADKFGYSYSQLKQWLNGRRKNKSTLQFA